MYLSCKPAVQRTRMPANTSERGALSRLLFGRKRKAKKEDDASAQAEAIARTNEVLASEGVSITRAFSRSLPTFDEFPDLVQRLKDFDWNRRFLALPSAHHSGLYDPAAGVGLGDFSVPPDLLNSADRALTIGIFKLCEYYLGGDANKTALFLNPRYFAESGAPTAPSLASVLSRATTAKPTPTTTGARAGNAAYPFASYAYIEQQYAHMSRGPDLKDYFLRILLGASNSDSNLIITGTTDGTMEHVYNNGNTNGASSSLNGDTLVTKGLHLSSAQREALKNPIVFPQDIKDRMVSMYPHIMVMIKALLVHLCHNADERHNDVTSMQQTVMRIWRDILGDLDAIRIVLVHADEHGIITLGEVPRAWDDLIKETVERVHYYKVKIHAAEDVSTSLRAQLVFRAQALNELHAKYDTPLHEFELLQAQLARLHGALVGATDVEGVLRSYKQRDINEILQKSLGAAAP